MYMHAIVILFKKILNLLRCKTIMYISYSNIAKINWETSGSIHLLSTKSNSYKLNILTEDIFHESSPSFDDVPVVVPVANWYRANFLCL